MLSIKLHINMIMFFVCFMLILLKTLIRVIFIYNLIDLLHYFNGSIVFFFIAITLASIRIKEKGGIKEDYKIFILSNQVESFVIG